VKDRKQIQTQPLHLPGPHHRKYTRRSDN
jgi:hypothetical protein